MKKALRALFLGGVVLLVATFVYGAAPQGIMAFTVSMETPSTHYFHVVFRGEGLKGETQDFKMPVWTPGFYQIMNYSRNVLNFCAEDGAGKPLEWTKITKNTWRVKSGRSDSIVISYDVYAFTRFVAESYLDDEMGFISPTGIFMHVAGWIQQPVTVTIKPYQNWNRISTGLDAVEGKSNTFIAPNFDILYDCPILVGNQEILTFEVQGIPHIFAVDNLGTFDRKKFVADHKRIVETAAALIGEIPYRHYAFLVIGPGGGGLEHSNSTALTLNPSDLNDPSGYKRWLRFVAHEFFHLYNVKRIRPIALGPFDYDKENYTHMLWVSEGFTAYYEDVILRRAGLITRDDVFEAARMNIANYENIPGHRFQSAAESSFDTWLHSFGRADNAVNTTISYYDKGAALGMLLDFKIRAETKNRKSLDDVMRVLYQEYYKEKNRGFTDDEFRAVCERIAGCPLAEIFDIYVSTTKDIDYPKYLAYAGLDIDIQPQEGAAPYSGVSTRERDGKLIVSGVEWDSPAMHAGLSAEDEIIALDSIRVNARSMSELLLQKKPADVVRVLISRRDTVREVEVVLGKRQDRSFAIKPVADPTPLQSEILRSWLAE
ncbi:MAG: PDZ domain-containing protein [Candidatus Aminicenantales bacterium]